MLKLGCTLCPFPDVLPMSSSAKRRDAYLLLRSERRRHDGSKVNGRQQSPVRELNIQLKKRGVGGLSELL